MKSPLHLLACVAGWLCALASAAAQTVYVSNLGEPPVNGILIASDRWIAQPFVSGTSVGYELDTISFSSAGAFGSPSGFSLRLFSDNAGSPGSSLGSLIGSEPTPSGVYTYTASGITLSASTKYWAVLSADTDIATGGYFWRLAGTANFTSQDGWSLAVGESMFSANSGGIWTGSGNNYMLSVSGSAVPEPASTAVFMGAVALISAWVIRRKAGQVGLSE